MPDANELRRLRHERAKQHRCPRCMAEPGQPCQKIIPWNQVWDSRTGRVKATEHGPGHDHIGGLHKARWKLYEERSAVERLGEIAERDL